jgi:WhiB family redox-sensing transcriptional regulator
MVRDLHFALVAPRTRRYVPALLRAYGGEFVALGMVHEIWHLKAACRGPESALFFPPSWAERRDEREDREARAKAICRECGVREECLDFALRVREPHGIWGGLTEAERRRILARELV